MGTKLEESYQKGLLKEYFRKARYLKSTQEIEEWCKSTFEGKKVWERRLPSTISKDEYEKKLGKKLDYIRQIALKQYYEVQDLEEIENEEDRTIVEIIRRLEKEYGMSIYLKNAQEIEEWCKSTFEGKKLWKRRLPKTTAKDEYEKHLAQKLWVIRRDVLKQYKGQELQGIEDKDDRKIVEIIRRLDKEYGMKAYLKNALEVEEWCKSTFEGKKVWERRLPSQTAQDKYEKQLGEKLSAIRQNVLKQYEGEDLEKIEDEEDRKIVEIIRNLDKEYKISLEDKKKMKKKAEMESQAAKVLCGEYEARLKEQEERKGENK